MYTVPMDTTDSTDTTPTSTVATHFVSMIVSSELINYTDCCIIISLVLIFI